VTNKVHFACFDCRKAFKQRGSSNWDATIPQRAFQCPCCMQPMVRLGRYFKAPRQHAVRQWLKVELLYHYGECFEASTLKLDVKCSNLVNTVAYLASAGHPADEVQACLQQLKTAHQARGKSG
jgi:hypothetical protein